MQTPAHEYPMILGDMVWNAEFHAWGIQAMKFIELKMQSVEVEDEK